MRRSIIKIFAALTFFAICSCRGNVDDGLSLSINADREVIPADGVAAVTFSVYDLKELHAAYPETQKYKHIRDLPDGVRQEFGKYRDLGLSAKKAYAAANPDGIRTDTATAVKKQVQHASKDHLKSSVPKPSKSDGVSMTKAELAYWRETFPGKSDAEIKRLYKQSL